MTATIDPRIRERRIEVKREAGRKRLRITLVVLSVFLALGSVYLLVQSPMLDVDHVRVAGVTRFDPAAVVQTAAVPNGSPLLRVDTGAVRARVERLPWVAHAKVSRALPGTLKIAVQERVPVAYARRDAAHIAVLDATGSVITDLPAPIEGLVEIRGMKRVPAIGARLTPAPAAGVVAELPPALGSNVGAIDVTSGVTLVLRSGGEVRLCTAEDLVAKGAATEAVIARLAGQPFTYIDVCVPQSPVSR